MLVNCPRCGFSQPDDQYCAQCGVDMRAYKQKEKPLLQKIFGNAGVQAGVLIVAAALIGQSIFHSRGTQSWVRQITHFQGVSKSTAHNVAQVSSEPVQLVENEVTNESMASTAAEQAKQTGTATDVTTQKTASSAAEGTNQPQSDSRNNTAGAQNLSSVDFKITYAEVSAEILAKWASDSTNAGLFQNLPEYSAGILSDFKKRSDHYQQTLKTADIKLNLGSGNSNLSGNISRDGNELLGMITSIEYKSNENDIIHGEINVTKSSSQGTENYPAEFNLPKGAAFFIIGALKQENFRAERAKLTMPPFQIFKSPDFMTHKTEFVIIVEPNYN